MLRRAVRPITRARAVRPITRAWTRRYTAPPLRDMRFLLFEVHGITKHYEALAANGDNETCDAETIDMIMDATASLCTNELAPINAAADRDGCVRVDGNHVKTPPGFKDAYNLYAESGWQALSFPEKYGGQGLPLSLSLIQSEMIAAANWTWLMFPGLSKGCINTLLAHGSEELKDAWLPPLLSGEFTGTMCLTEPQCGSDLGQITTRAVPQPDGSYKLVGTKIFISCGEHDLVDNIVHCVLARLPDAPEGTKGISLFLVPKRLVEEDSSVGQLNGVSVSRIEDKMGCHGSPTCQLEFDDATGWLIGQPNRGLNHMFTFINTSRVGTAVQGVAAAERAFQLCLGYAKERKSMRALSGTVEPDSIADPIIHHASVRSMLLFQKCVAEGGRSMLYECAQIADKMQACEASGDLKGAKAYDERLGFLTPILKGFLTEAGKEAADHGLQVWGGHGYIKDNGLEQVYRDIRIGTLWEGTTQIQALDLLGRKVLLQKLKPINEHCAELRGSCAPLLWSGGALGKHAWQLWFASIEWQLLTYRIAARAATNRDAISAASVDYLMLGGYVSLAHHWLKMEAVATEITTGKGGDGVKEDYAFYEAKRQCSAYVFERLLTRTRAHAAAIRAPTESVMGLKVDAFSFDH